MYGWRSLKPADIVLAARAIGRVLDRTQRAGNGATTGQAYDAAARSTIAETDLTAPHLQDFSAIDLDTSASGPAKRR